jgi:Tfp pilus assembly protein PilE
MELMTVMIIIGLLAAIAMSRLSHAKERADWTTVKSDLREFVTQQERYYSRNMAYSSNFSDVPDVSLSPGVTIDVVWSANNGWAATATHSHLTGKHCGYFIGPAPSGVAPPATNAGEIKCDE